jgi:hypothetical protein
MESSEYFVRRAWDCYHLLGHSTDERVAQMIRESERAFIARAIDAGVPPRILPPPDASPASSPNRAGD